MSMREIFSYQDGCGGTRYGDPLWIDYQVRQGMDEHGGLDSVLQRVDLQDQAACMPGVLQVAEVVAQVFGVQRLDPLTGQGLTLDGMLDLLHAFFAFKSDVKKNTDTSPSGPPPTPASPPSRPGFSPRPGPGLPPSRPVTPRHPAEVPPEVLQQVREQMDAQATRIAQRKREAGPTP